MIYRWFKRNRPFPKARDVAARSHVNRARKLQWLMSEIAELLAEAVDRGDRDASYQLDPGDAYVLDELAERLRASGYMVTHSPPDDDYGITVTLSWLPPKGIR